MVAHMAHWLFKTEPSEYSFEALVRDGKAVWDGVTNPVALRNLRQARRGDGVIIYHTGDERAAVGRAEIAREAYPDPRAKDDKHVVVELEPRGRLQQPVGLATIKSHHAFRDSPLVRQGRLSVVPLTDEQWRVLGGS
jgi:predicted RNA-binding protein with PUA-like domain